MATLVQTFPQQSGAPTMLQPRPLSNPGSGNQQYMSGSSHSHRNSFHGLPSGIGGPPMYRATAAPIQPYAFTSTPTVNTNNMPWQQQFGAFRNASSPAVPTVSSLEQMNGSGRSRYGTSASMTNLSYNPSMGLGKSGSRDDSSIRQPRTVTTAPRPQSAYMSGTSPQLSFAQAVPVKASPERYRRPAPHQQRSQISSQPSGSGMSAVSHLYTSHNPNSHRRNSNSGSNPSQGHRPSSFSASVPGSSADDIQLHRQSSQEETKRLRRRSMHTLDSADYPKPLTPREFASPEECSRPETASTPKTADKEQKTLRLVSDNGSVDNNNMQLRNGSSESLVSTRSSTSRPSSSANRTVSIPTGNPSSIPSTSDDSQPKQDYPKLVNIPLRGSSTDAGKRITAPSPLSRPVTMASDTEPQTSPSSLGDATDVPSSPPATGPGGGNMDSPAVKQLAAINQKGVKAKSKTSRLRRAFSFGSAADFKKATDPDSAPEDGDKSEPSKLHKDPSVAELYDAEQARIAKKQEEGGIGNSIYGGKLFSGSTDNLSISSTASSASIMIRKMGRGVKRSTRSLVGLFRPKSVIGAPDADAMVPDASQASVSMVTVEAEERERVNVSADVHAHHAGGTGFPHLERNSIDTAKTPSMVSERAGSSGTDNSGPRKSIVGGDRERAEVLAAVRKGILKNTSRSSSPSQSPADTNTGATNGAALELPGVPGITESPQSSAPSTPNDEAQGHKRTGSVAIGNEDYFVTALRLRQDTKSAPGTPLGTIKRNATFSPRIVFYDTWPSQEYDRRGEIATCNRLTPMLAQQIKEELNNFKMEMEVHENSKIYTHFF